MGLGWFSRWLLLPDLLVIAAGFVGLRCSGCQQILRLLIWLLVEVDMIVGQG